MNKVMLMGRLTRDPETRYSKGETSMAITRFGLAVNRRFVRNGEAEADFFNLVSFGKNAEFIDKYFRKGMLVSIVGRVQNNNWEDKNGVKRYDIDIVVEEQFFAESKSSFENRGSSGHNFPSHDNNNDTTSSNDTNQSDDDDGFSSLSENLNDEDLPF